MEFISAEEFLKQPKEIQKVFLDWWQPSVGDIAVYKAGHSGFYSWYMSCITCESDIKKVLHEIPLLTEGLLRNFIEDKTECIVSVICEDYENTYGYKIIHGFGHYDYKENTDLLQDYWQVAVKIASEEVNNKGVEEC